MHVNSLLPWTAAASLLISTTFAQSLTKCNPLHVNCPPNPALSKSVHADFVKNEYSDFENSGGPFVRGPQGAELVISKSGEAPQLSSRWYIMFGRVDVSFKASPGAGIVSSVVLLSDDLDEIDFEWLGSRPNVVQSNYFDKGFTRDFKRGGTHDAPGSHTEFHTYTIDWNADRIIWEVDGRVLRTETSAAVGDAYPQSPMRVLMGSWSGGDPSNPPGTIEWSGGPTDYTKGPFVMSVQSVSVTDYSSGSHYKYSTQSGRWQDITAENGKVNPHADMASVPVNNSPSPPPQQSKPTTPDSPKPSDVPLNSSGPGNDNRSATPSSSLKAGLPESLASQLSAPTPNNGKNGPFSSAVVSTMSPPPASSGSLSSSPSGSPGSDSIKESSNMTALSSSATTAEASSISSMSPDQSSSGSIPLPSAQESSSMFNSSSTVASSSSSASAHARPLSNGFESSGMMFAFMCFLFVLIFWVI